MSTKSNFVNGIPELLILQLLSHEEMYGYQLVMAIRDRSRETFQFGEGCLYPILHRLAASHYLSTRREVVNGRPRHYYKTSPSGQKHLDALRQEWTSVVTGAQAILGGLHAY